MDPENNGPDLEKISALINNENNQYLLYIDVMKHLKW